MITIFNCNHLPVQQMGILFIYLPLDDKWQEIGKFMGNSEYNIFKWDIILVMERRKMDGLPKSSLTEKTNIGNSIVYPLKLKTQHHNLW